MEGGYQAIAYFLARDLQAAHKVIEEHEQLIERQIDTQVQFREAINEVVEQRNNSDALITQMERQIRLNNAEIERLKRSVLRLNVRNDRLRTMPRSFFDTPENIRQNLGLTRQQAIQLDESASSSESESDNEVEFVSLTPRFLNFE